jgi:hypothetical protein
MEWTRILAYIVVDRDDIARRTRRIIGHGGPFWAILVAFAASSSARFGPPALVNCAKNIVRHLRRSPALGLNLKKVGVEMNVSYL